MEQGLTFVTAAMNVSSEIGWSVLLEKVKDIVITAGVGGSRATCNEILRFVSLTKMVFEDG